MKPQKYGTISFYGREKRDVTYHEWSSNRQRLEDELERAFEYPRTYEPTTSAHDAFEHIDDETQRWLNSFYPYS